MIGGSKNKGSTSAGENQTWRGLDGGSKRTRVNSSQSRKRRQVQALKLLGAFLCLCSPHQRCRLGDCRVQRARRTNSNHDSLEAGGESSFRYGRSIAPIVAWDGGRVTSRHRYDGD